MNKNRYKKGFTLPEILVSISVMVLVIVASTSLVVSVIRSNTENIHTMIAYGLAQEGLEGVRNIRDSNWLLGAKFNGMLKNNPIWGAEFSNLESDAYYVIELDSMEKTWGGAPDVNSLVEPWRLRSIEKDQLEEKSKIYKYVIEGRSGEFRYGHYGNVLMFGEKQETPFHRYITIRKVRTDYDKPGEINKVRVSSVVAWMEGARSKEVRLDTELTNWNKGQL